MRQVTKQVLLELLRLKEAAYLHPCNSLADYRSVERDIEMIKAKLGELYD